MEDKSQNKRAAARARFGSFPNKEAINAKRVISINRDEFRRTTPNPSVGGKTEAIWKRVN